MAARRRFDLSALPVVIVGEFAHTPGLRRAVRIADAALLADRQAQESKTPAGTGVGEFTHESSGSLPEAQPACNSKRK